MFDSPNYPSCTDARIRDLIAQVDVPEPLLSLRDQAARKQAQICFFLKQLKAEFRRLPRNRHLVLVDCCCGKSDLPFALTEYAHRVLERDVYLIGVDYNPALVAQCCTTARGLLADNMEFHCCAITEFSTNRHVDALYAIHACGNATDESIAAGVRLKSRLILATSCCQRTIPHKVPDAGLSSLLRFECSRKALTAVVRDSMRVLLLEASGYCADLFEFCPPTVTPKNILLRAYRGQIAKSNMIRARAQYEALAEAFKVRSYLEDLLPTPGGHML